MFNFQLSLCLVGKRLSELECNTITIYSLLVAGCWRAVLSRVATVYPLPSPLWQEDDLHWHLDFNRSFSSFLYLSDTSCTNLGLLLFANASMGVRFWRTSSLHSRNKKKDTDQGCERVHSKFTWLKFVLTSLYIVFKITLTWLNLTLTDLYWSLTCL